jgi:CDGSH-type Zn-finger protein
MDQPTPAAGPATLLAHAEKLIRAAAAVDTDRGRQLAARIESTVARPLREWTGPTDGPASATGRPSPDDLEPGVGPAPNLERDLGDLAEALLIAAAATPEPFLLEACAGACRLLAGARAEGMPRPDAGARGRVTVRRDGPYLLSTSPDGTPEMTTWLGEQLTSGSLPPVVALCRCGRSADKPFCDGTHAVTGFSGAKHDDRVPDRQDDYPARDFHVRDNRGLCAHSGRCTDAAPTAFRTGQEPFVAPAGARADELLRAVKACPSGALGAAIGGVRRPELVDTQRPAAIEVSKDGPYRLTGSIDVVEESAGGTVAPVVRPADASPEHCSLCRCGQSANKPFCSGAHWYADFHDPVRAADAADPTLFEWAGGYPALLRLTRIFYERHVAEDELLAGLFSRMQPDHPERVASWLSEVFGGPELYSRRYGGYARMISQHVGKSLSEAQRARWVTLLGRSADDAGLPADPEFRAAFSAYLEWGSRIAKENSQQDARPPEGMPVPRWWWVCDATPSARQSALPSPDVPAAPQVTAPADDEPVSFARHVRGLFRARDRGSMSWAFDLWAVDDVRTHARQVLARLEDGSMPCDGAWPSEHVAVFRRWMEEGCAD